MITPAPFIPTPMWTAALLDLLYELREFKAKVEAEEVKPEAVATK